MIKLFNTLDKIYTSNGDVVLNPKKAVVHKEDNGSFYLNLETGLDEKEYKSEEIEGQTIEGTNFNIDVDLSKEYSFDSFKGNTTQNGTPTPSNPVNVNVVTGGQEIGVAGKNLLYSNITYPFTSNGVTVTQESDGSVTLNGTQTGALHVIYNNAFYKNIKSYEGKTISISLTTSGTGSFSNFGIKQGTSPDLFISSSPATSKTGILNLNGYTNITFDIWFSNSARTFVNYNIKPQVEVGNVTEWEQYNGNTYEINLGKNLFDISKYSNAILRGAGNNVALTEENSTTLKILNKVSSTRNFCGIQIPNSSNLLGNTITVNADITINGNTDTAFQFWFMNSTSLLTEIGTAKKITSNGNQTYTATIPNTMPNNATGIAIVIYGSFDAQAVINSYVIFNKIQIEKGSVATTFAPYKTPIELCKIGDYQDRIYKDSGKWYLEKKIGKYTFTGNEVMNLQNNRKRIYMDSRDNSIPDPLHTPSVSTKYGLYSDKLVEATAGQTWGGVQGISYDYNTGKNTGNFDISINGISTLADYRTAIAGIIIYYILQTPTTTEITDNELINQLESIELIEGINNISSNGNLPIIMNLHYNYRNAYSNVVKYNDYLTSGHIIVANTPQGEQAFRITNVEKTRSKIKIKANHVFYDSVNYLIEDSYVVDKSCNDALDHLNNATSDLSPFTTISNVTNIASYRCVRKSLYEAIQVVLERWGGHLVRDNWTIGIYDSIGQDNGVTIRYAKNLKNITATYNWDDVVTKLMPVGKDGILLNAIDPNVSVYVEALNPYVVPFTKTISFSQDNIEEDNYRDEDGNLDEDAYKQALVEDLYAQATHYVEEHQVPSVNYSLSANVEKISDIGDTIQVTDERLGIDLLTHVISYDYDCILEQYKQLEFGNFTPQLSNLVTTIERKTDEIVRESTATIQVTLNNELQQATSQIWSALSDSYVIYEGDKILIVDTLPKEDATNVIMINNGGIGFSNTGINGQFNSAWTIDNVLNMEQINVINLTADMIKGGTLKLGSNLNQNGRIEVFDESNTLIAELNKNGLKMYGVDGSYVLMNNEVGFAGYDRNDNKIYWVAQDEFHMKKSVVEEEITLCNKLRFIPIEVYNGNTLVNDGIGLVSVAGGGN